MPPLAEIIVAALLLCSALVVLVAAFGLRRLPDFFSRMHAPALASTLGAWIVTLASIIHFSTRGGGLALHVWLVIIVLSITESGEIAARLGGFSWAVKSWLIPP